MDHHQHSSFQNVILAHLIKIHTQMTNFLLVALPYISVMVRVGLQLKHRMADDIENLTASRSPNPQ